MSSHYPANHIDRALEEDIKALKRSLKVAKTFRADTGLLEHLLDQCRKRRRERKKELRKKYPGKVKKVYTGTPVRHQKICWGTKKVEW